MQHKRHIKSQGVYKWKAHLNVHGGQQVHRINYWDTYTPVVAWPVIRFFFILSIIHHTRLDVTFLRASCEEVSRRGS